MKSRTLLLITTTAVFALLLLSTSCKKKRAFNEEDAQDTVDARIIQGEVDEIVKDVNTVIMEQFNLRGKSAEGSPAAGSASTSICGVRLDSNGLNSGIGILTYTGQTCYGRLRTGEIKFTILGYPSKKWKHQGCSLKIEFKAYKLHRVSDGKSFLFEGEVLLVNETGNTWYELHYLNVPQVAYHLSGEGMRVTFDNEDFVKYNFSRRMFFSTNNFVTTCRIEGTGSANGKSKVENWGQARKGETFTSEIISPVVWRTSCGSVAPVAGEINMSISGKEHILKCTFAVDGAGNDVSGTDSPCPYGWKVHWNYKTKTKDRIFSYY